MESVDTTLREIDELKNYYLRAKSLFPYLTKSNIGQAEIGTPQFYQQHEFRATLKLQRALTSDDRNNFNVTGHWINASSIIWLNSLLEQHGAFDEYKSRLKRLLKKSPKQTSKNRNFVQW